MSETTETPPRWLRIELMGHSTTSGQVMEFEAFGTRWMRVETQCPEGHVVRVRFINPQTAVYGFNELPEDVLRAEALDECKDPSHPLFCQSCGLKRPGTMRLSCPACGYVYHQMQPRERSVTPENFAESSPSYALRMIERAGAEVTPRDERQSASQAFWSVPIEQRIAAVAWAMAFHRAKLGEAVDVPERPAFLRDRQAHDEPEEGADDDVPM